MNKDLLNIVNWSVAMGKTIQAKSESAATAAAQMLWRTMARCCGIAKNHYTIECFDPEGNRKWAMEGWNLIPNVGLDDILDKYYKGSAYTAALYVFLKGSGTVAAGDTMASHAGWSEVTDYDESVRQTLTLAAVASQSVDNSASKAVFSINATVTIAGAGLCTVNTKGGSTGILAGATDFASAKNAESGDTINVTITCTQSAG